MGAAAIAAVVAARGAHAQSATLVVRTPEPARVAALVGSEPVAPPVLCVRRCTLVVPPGSTRLRVEGPRGAFTTRVFTVPPQGAQTRLRLGSRREGTAAAWIIASAVSLLASVALIGVGSACLGSECNTWWAVTAGWSGIALFAAAIPLGAVGIVEAARLGDGLTYVVAAPGAADAAGARAVVVSPVSARF